MFGLKLFNKKKKESEKKEEVSGVMGIIVQRNLISEQTREAVNALNTLKQQAEPDTKEQKAILTPEEKSEKRRLYNKEYFQKNKEKRMLQQKEYHRKKKLKAVTEEINEMSEVSARFFENLRTQGKHMVPAMDVRDCLKSKEKKNKKAKQDSEFPGQYFVEIPSTTQETFQKLDEVCPSKEEQAAREQGVLAAEAILRKVAHIPGMKRWKIKEFPSENFHKHHPKKPGRPTIYTPEEREERLKISREKSKAKQKATRELAALERYANSENKSQKEKLNNIAIKKEKSESREKDLDNQLSKYTFLKPRKYKTGKGVVAFNRLCISFDVKFIKNLYQDFPIQNEKFLKVGFNGNNFIFIIATEFDGYKLCQKKNDRFCMKHTERIYASFKINLADWQDVVFVKLELDEKGKKIGFICSKSEIEKEYKNDKNTR